VSNNKNKISALCEYLKKNHTGRENAASSKTLEVVFHVDGREIRRFVNQLRQKGFPICSNTSGYYYASTQQEINESIARLNSLITKISNAKNGLLNSSLIDEVGVFIEINIDIDM